MWTPLYTGHVNWPGPQSVHISRFHCILIRINLKRSVDPYLHHAFTIQTDQGVELYIAHSLCTLVYMHMHITVNNQLHGLLRTCTHAHAL